MEKPILNAIRQLIKFKGAASLSEIARISGEKQAKVLEILNLNRPFIKVDKRGRVVSVNLRQPLRDYLFNDGAFYYIEDANYGSDKVLRFKNDELFNQLKTSTYYGGFGDSYPVDRVEDTPENRAALEAAGIVPFRESLIDDRLWQGEQLNGEGV